MSETEFGREPVVLVEIEAPKCAIEYGSLPCRAGLGDVDTSALTVDFSAGLQGWWAYKGILTAISGGVNFVGGQTDPSLRLEAVSPGFDGDLFGFVVMRGRINIQAATEWRIFYHTASGLVPHGARTVDAQNKSEIELLPNGSEFIAYFDMSGLADYATVWQGQEITGFRIDMHVDAGGDVDIYSIDVCSEDPQAALATSCFKSLTTCQDITNFDGSNSLKMRFCQPGAWLPSGVYAIPALVSTDTAPTVINIANGVKSRSPLGSRAVARAVFGDLPYNDHLVDPHLDDRTYTAIERGSFWSKWLARNQHREGLIMTIYEGYAGQTLAEMNTRTYEIEKIDGLKNGRVTISAKDPLRRVSDGSNLIPEASPGKLSADIAVGDLTFEVAGANLGDYDAAGKIRIGAEIMSYTAVAIDGGTQNVVFSGCVRGVNGSEAKAAKQGDRVQRCLVLTNMTPASTMEYFLTTGGGIDASYIPTADWTTENDTFLNTFLFDEIVISEPTKTTVLIGELEEECLCYVWWDERSKKVLFSAVRPPFDAAPILTEGKEILAGSFSIVEKPETRLSQIWTYYNRRNLAVKMSEDENFANVQIDIGGGRYTEPRIREIRSRYIVRGAEAIVLGAQLTKRFEAPRKYCTFRVDAKDRNSYWTNSLVEIQHKDIVDAWGAETGIVWQITSAEEVVPGHIVEFTAENYTGGSLRLTNWASDTEVDYDLASGETRATVLFWADESGKMPNGDDGYLWI